MNTSFSAFCLKVIIFLTMFSMISCSENVGVSIVSVEDVSARSAVIKGVMDRRNATLGFCISDTSDNPLGSNSRIITPVRVEKDNTFSASVKGLKPGTKYFFRAFSKRGKNIQMSSTVQSFTTDSIRLMSIDLGLSVLWSNCNVGANLPECGGKYLSWTETSCLSNDSWRLPTVEEYKELLSKCKWHWTTLSGTSGYEVNSSNGNSIFLPAAGAVGGEHLYGFRNNGGYWTSTRSSYSCSEAMCLKFTSGYMDVYSENDKYGFSIRLVRISQ